MKKQFSPRSPVNCAEANTQALHERAEESCSNDHECRTDSMNQTQGLVFITATTSSNFSAAFLYVCVCVCADWVFA